MMTDQLVKLADRREKQKTLRDTNCIQRMVSVQTAERNQLRTDLYCVQVAEIGNAKVILKIVGSTTKDI